jgi:aromatic ring-opening dioxygenase catalytic subunit (LigB family)
MGQIVGAFATVHAPQLFTRPPSEVPEQMDADVAAMKLVAKDLDELKPDAVIILGSDHLETFFLSSVPTFAVIAGETSKAHFATKSYEMKVHLPLAEAIIDGLVKRDFDMAYSQDALLGHSFAAVYEWIIADRGIPVIPIFINTYLPPLPSPQRCYALGKAIGEIIASRPERVVIVASGGMSHYPGTWKYPQPAYDFDYWAIAQLERGNTDALMKLSSEQLDEVGNTELLPWYPMFGAIGNNHPGELITYQPTWHHGHAVMRFLPNKRTGPPTGEMPPAYEFQQGGFEFYKHPHPSAYNLNKVLYELRLQPELRKRLFTDYKEVAKNYSLTPEETRALGMVMDENIDALRSLKPHPLVDAGAHPLGMLMSLVVVQAEMRRMRAAGTLPANAVPPTHASN